jgi:hypothetical protein
MLCQIVFLSKLINIGASPPTFRLFKWPLTPATWDGHITSLSSGVWLLTPYNISSVRLAEDQKQTSVNLGQSFYDKYIL